MKYKLKVGGINNIDIDPSNYDKDFFFNINHTRHNKRV